MSAMRSPKRPARFFPTSSSELVATGLPPTRSARPCLLQYAASQRRSHFIQQFTPITARLHSALRAFSQWSLESHSVSALQRKDFTRLVGRGNLEAQRLDDSAGLRHLLGVRLRKLAGTDPQ